MVFPGRKTEAMFFENLILRIAKSSAILFRWHVSMILLVIIYDETITLALVLTNLAFGTHLTYFLEINDGGKWHFSATHNSLQRQAVG